MKTLLNYISILLLLVSCKGKILPSPVWVNKIDTVSAINFNLIFATKEKGWKANLISYSQPVPLVINFSDSTLSLHSKYQEGITEGPATLHLFKGANNFYYFFYLKNGTNPDIKQKDYRSPKTVNPDSSLLQQQITHDIDFNRNLTIIRKRKDNYFHEKNLLITSKEGVYRAQKNIPLSAYYLQPGSCTNIPLKVIYKRIRKTYEITAGPLKDKHNNTTADGTLVTFIYNDGNYNYRIESTLLNGVTTVRIPKKNKTMQLKAIVHHTESSIINLKQTL